MYAQAIGMQEKNLCILSERNQHRLQASSSPSSSSSNSSSSSSSSSSMSSNSSDVMPCDVDVTETAPTPLGPLSKSWHESSATSKGPMTRAVMAGNKF